MSLRDAHKHLLTRTLAFALAVVVCGASLDWGHVGGDDPDCSITIVLHDHTAHRFTPAPPAGSQVPEHCYICHSLRLLHNALTATGSVPGLELSSTNCRHAGHLLARRVGSAALASRAPPAVRL
jgi:hypothetical protein